MWEWQHTFFEGVKSLLESVLKSLPFESHYNVFVLGIPVDKSEGTVCFEPEKRGFSPSDFDDVGQRADQKYAKDPRRNLMMAAEHLMGRYQESLWGDALKESVLEALGAYDSNCKAASFCSLPVLVRKHWVMSVVQLERQAVESLHRLQRDRQAIHELRYFELEQSLLDSAIRRVLAKSQQELMYGTRGENIFIEGAERVVEDAAVRLMSTIGMRINRMGGGIFNIANTVSAERYEGAEGRGRMLLARKGHPDVIARIRLKSPVSISQYRGIRKLLETSSVDLALLCDGMEVWGLGVPKGTYDSCRGGPF
jgi:hypothetical protein